jgi:hypothetical protein
MGRKTHDCTNAKKHRHALKLVEMNNTFEAENIDVLGMVMDKIMSNQVVNDAHVGVINMLSQVEGMAPLQVTKELAMVVHDDVVETHEVANADGVATVVVIV